MPIFLTDDAKKNLMTFIVKKSMSEKPSEEKPQNEVEPDEISGSLYAAEKLMSAIKEGDAKTFDKALGEWFDMRPGESESYSNSEEESEK